VVNAMVLYNLGTVLVLGAAGLGSQPVGIASWPAVNLHAGMIAWCIAYLRRTSPNLTQEREVPRHVES
jgi:hypothetical protein